MKLKNEKLIAELIEITRENLNQIEKFIQLDNNELNWKENPASWSILECVAHLNIYGDFYTPEITKCIFKASSENKEVFKTGVLGNKFVTMIQHKEKLNKMKTKKEFNPVGSALNKNVLLIFKEHQFQMLDLLSKATAVNLTSAKTAISISKIIKMRLGDTFRFVIYHNQRHIIQANKVLSKTGK